MQIDFELLATYAEHIGEEELNSEIRDLGWTLSGSDDKYVAEIMPRMLMLAFMSTHLSKKTVNSQETVTKFQESVLQLFGRF
jgi:hypothetical protein